MSFRTDPKDFPIGIRNNSTSYILIDWDNKTEHHFSLISEKQELIKLLSQIVDAGKENNYSLLGVWVGTFKTDTFKIPISLGLEQLKTVYPSNE